MDNEEVKPKNQVTKPKDKQENIYRIDLSIDYTVTKELVEVVKNHPDYVKPDSAEEAAILFKQIPFKDKFTSLIKTLVQTNILATLIKIKLSLAILFNIVAILLYLILDISNLVFVLFPVNIIVGVIIVLASIILLISHLIVREIEGVSAKVLRDEYLTNFIVKSRKVIFKILKIFGLMGNGKGSTGALLTVLITESYREEMLVEHQTLRDKINSLIDIVELHKLINIWENAMIFFKGSDTTLREILKIFLRRNPSILIRLSLFDYTEDEKLNTINQLINDWEQQAKNIFYEANYILDDGLKRQHLLEYLLIYIKKYIRHYYGINYSQVNVPFHEIKDYDLKIVVGSKVFMLDTMAVKKEPNITYEENGFKYEYEKHLVYTIPEKTVVLEDEVDILQNNLDSEQFADNQRKGIYDYKKMQRHLNGEDYVHISIGQKADRAIKGLRELDTGYLKPDNLEIIPAFIWKIDKIRERIERIRIKIFKDLERVKNYKLGTLITNEDKEIFINYRKKTVERLDKIHALENQIGLYQRKNRVKINWVLSTNASETGKLYSLNDIARGKYDRNNPHSFNAIAPVTQVFDRYNTKHMKAILDFMLDNSKINYYSLINWNSNNLEMDRHHVIAMNYPIYYKFYNVTKKEIYTEPKYTQVSVKAIPLDNEKKTDKEKKGQSK